MKGLLNAFFTCAVFICIVLTGLLGLAQIFWPGFTSQLAFPLLLKLAWLYGFIIEAAFLIPRGLRIIRRLQLVPIITVTAGLLQVGGLGISFYDDDTGRYVAFAGGSLFHLSAAAAFSYCLKHKIARHRKVVSFTVIYTFAALGGFGFIPISNRNTFLLANCILGCCLNVGLLVLVQIEGHKEGDGATSADLRDDSGLSARLSLGEYNLDIKERNVGVNRPIVLGQQTIHTEKYGLPTSPPSPPSISTPTWNMPEKTCRRSILDIKVLENGVQARMLVMETEKDRTVLRLVTESWDMISRDLRLQLEEYIGETAYYIATQLSQAKGGTGMVIFAEPDLSDCGFPSQDCKTLSDGGSLEILGQTGLDHIRWMCMKPYS
ncbi:hypothetical protein BDV95DRAFT_598200 [Massariosphaeria phaeospora]|uniref:Uncharacterized protein n=1 Tax=Massariosphaeria phaeospora TaxID=100035 RepID=A0A7C8I3J6_9PLEO|nr:hypothetical protein BDV95DRAFT_598200 [Massariosphaeria phaeospora]